MNPIRSFLPCLAAAVLVIGFTPQEEDEEPDCAATTGLILSPLVRIFSLLLEDAPLRSGLTYLVGQADFHAKLTPIKLQINARHRYYTVENDCDRTQATSQ